MNRVSDDVVVVNNPIWLDEFRRIGWPVGSEEVAIIIPPGYGHYFMCVCYSLIAILGFEFLPGRSERFGWCRRCKRLYKVEQKVIPMRDITPAEYRRLVEGGFDEPEQT